LAWSKLRIQPFRAMGFLAHLGSGTNSNAEVCIKD
jgi:hypothetical protein